MLALAGSSAQQNCAVGLSAGIDKLGKVFLNQKYHLFFCISCCHIFYCQARKKKNHVTSTTIYFSNKGSDKLHLTIT